MVHDLLWRALSNDLATVHAGTWADVHHVVGQTYGVLVVLHHDHRVTQVAQVVEGGQQAVVVPLMKTDGRFVEDVHHSDQAGTNLAGQADTLGLTARQRVGTAIEGQVVEADVDQELQAFADLLEDLCRNLAAAAGQVRSPK